MYRFYPWFFSIVMMIVMLPSTSAHVPGTSLNHNPQSAMFGNGIVTAITPDVRNRPATWVTGIGLDDLLNNDFVYDAFGNITEIGSDDYGYDNLNRLTTSTVNGTSFGYSYDSVGNIETVTKGGSPAGSFSYSQNRITGLTYDTDGNLTDDGVNTYVYDALGQTASVTNSGGTVSYRYDALGKRISANDGSVDTVYAYLGEALIAEYTGVDYSNSVFLEGQLLARVTDNGVDTTTVRYAHLNHLGSPVAFTDSTANVIWPEQVGGTPYEIHNYEPFGADFDDIGTPALSPQDVRYTGKLLDAGTGKHYFNARYLNAVTDVTSPELPPRFLSPDIVIGTPDSPQSWNRYASCLNNPVRYVDPDGLLERDKTTGELKFKRGRIGKASHEGDPKHSYYVQLVTLYTDKGNPIKASTVFEKKKSDPTGQIIDKVTSKTVADLPNLNNPMATDCHGVTFADGRFWIHNDQVNNILKDDDYFVVVGPGGAIIGDIVVYRNSSGEIVHSATVSKVDAYGFVTSVKGLGGLETVVKDLPLGTGPGTAWNDPSANYEVYRKP